MSKLRDITALFGIFIIFCSVLLLAFLDYGASAEVTVEDNWSWVKSKPVVYSSNDTESINQYMCDGLYQSVVVHPLIDNRMVCVKNNSSVRFGFYYENGINNAVISYSMDSKFYRLNFGCQIGDCLYLPGSDTLVVKTNLINGFVKSLVVYKNILKRIDFESASILQYKYNLDLTNPDYIFQSSSGYAWPIGGIGASENGRWLAVEFRERGIGLLNIDTLEMKHISASVLWYGQGYNPTTELAVSNSGQQVVEMGTNSGLTFLDLTSECGDLADDNSMGAGYIRKPCQQVGINSSEFIYRFNAGLYPKFKNDGAELTFFAISYDGKTKIKEVVLRAAGFQPMRLDYLAMGDSYSSGEGETDDKYYIDGTNTEFEKCHLSYRSYPFLLADLSGIDPQFMRSVACSGAVTNDIYKANEETYYGQNDRLYNENSPYMNKDEAILAQTYARYNFIPGRIRQGAFLEYYRPKTVTVGIGGNDINLVLKVKDCFLSIGTCSIAQASPERAQYALLIKDFYKRLISTFQDMISKSPSSKIYAVGYPGMIYVNGDCGALDAALDRTEREFMDESIKYLNQVIEAAAKNSGIGYIDRYNSLGIHVICGSGPDGGNVIRLGDDVGYGFFKPVGNESFHPTPFGNKLMADFIYSNIGSIESHQYCSNGKNVCPYNTPAPMPSSYWGVEDYSDLPKLANVNFLDKTEIQATDKSLKINIDDGTFEPNSDVEVAIFSERTELGLFMVNSNGGLSTSVTLPGDFEAGYHNIHIYGKSFSGEDIDIYQQVTILANNDNSQATSRIFENSSTKANNGSYVETSNNASGLPVDKVNISSVDSEKSNSYDSANPVSAVKGAKTINKHDNTSEAYKKLLYLFIGGVIILALMIFLIFKII